MAMPTFCRHNHLIQNCPICSREHQVDLRPVISSSAPRTAVPRERVERPASGRRGVRATSPGGVRVRKLARGGDDGYRSPLVPGLKSSLEAERLAEELAFAATRLRVLAGDPPGLYAEVAGDGDIEERTWLGFLIAYVGPGEGEDPFAAIRDVRTPWASGELPAVERIEPGPRGAHTADRGTRTLEAYRVWATRTGSQAAAFTGESGWPAPRRFARAFERLALPGLHRDARFDLLVTLGLLGLYELEPASLALGGENAVTLGAKRALGIGDPLLLDRRAAELAAACGLPLAALDLGLRNWQEGDRATGGLGPDTEPDADVLAGARAALGV
jgi:hypothetical protein